MIGQEMNKQRPFRVTLIYMVEERTRERIHDLGEQLRECGIDVFVFSDDMTLVESHTVEMQKQIENADAVIICYSENFDNEGRGYRHQEVRIAKEEQRKRPLGNAYLITINLDKCPVPPYLSEARVPNYFRKEHFDGIMRWGLVKRRNQLIETGEKIQGFKYHPPQQEHEAAETLLQRERADQAERLGVWNVPYLRNPYFTGRDELLEQLHQQFSRETQNESAASRRIALTQPQAIKGLGGIGKTQIAVEYAYRSRDFDRYTHTLWVNAAGEETLIANFVTIAALLPSFSATGETDQKKLIDAIKRWLEHCEQRWLLIFDNVEDIPGLHEYLPQRGNGSVLLTTRANAPGSLAASVEVETMGWVEGTELLLRRAQRFDQASDEERNEAGNIVIALDHFPLALDQAGAYIEGTKCGLVNYLGIYQTHRKELLAQRGDQAMDYPDSVATTWSLSFQKVEQANPAAAELLQLCAFLAPDKIPDELIIDGAEQWSGALQQSAADLFTFNNMMKELLRYSLVRRLSDDRAFSIHRLVQAVQRDMMEPEVQRQWAVRIVRAVNGIFPENAQESSNWPQCLRYLEQAQTCNTLVEQYALAFVEAAYLLDRTGIYLSEHALYTIAEPLYQRALKLWEQWDPENLGMTDPLNNLANLYLEQGKYTEAEPLYQLVLNSRERLLGPESPYLTNPLNNLACLYFCQGKYTEAELLYQRSLHIKEQQSGSDPIDLAHLYNNMADIYVEQEKYVEAELFYQRALGIRKQQLGVEHLDVANSLNGLASLYILQGKYTEAEPLCQLALHIREQLLGSEHPHVAVLLNNLGEICREQGKYVEAEPLYQCALQIWEQLLGSEHPHIADPLNNLANLYLRQEKYAEAEPLYQRALHIREQLLGPKHPKISSLLNNLAALYTEQEKYAEAELFYRRALDVNKQQKEPDSLSIAIALSGLAYIYAEQEKHAEAEPLYQRALHILEQQLGSGHPATKIAKGNYAGLLRAMRLNERASKLEEDLD